MAMTSRVVGIALPSIMKEMGVSPANVGFMVSSALFGMMFETSFEPSPNGSTSLDDLDLYSAVQPLHGSRRHDEDPISFSVTRFLAGVGIGGVMPNVIAQMTEYSPRKIRMMVTMMFERLFGRRHDRCVAGQGDDRVAGLAIGVLRRWAADPAHPFDPSRSTRWPT